MLLPRKKLLACLFAVTIISGCGGSSDDDGGTTETPVTNIDATTTNYDIYLPAGVIAAKPDGNFDGTMIYAGVDALSTSTLTGITLVGATSGGLTTENDVAGFIAETLALNNETSAGELVDSYEALLNTNGINFSSTGRTQGSAGYIAIANYNVTLATATAPTTLANELVQYIGVNTTGGTVTNLPVALSSEQPNTDYIMTIGVLYTSATQVIVVVTVVPQNVAGNYVALTSNLTNTSNIVPTGTVPTTTSDSFTAQGGSGKADFLFVIDNSGSMGDEQAAISAAATDFTSVISNSGLNYQIATITTDSATLRDTNLDGGFTTDLTEFEIDVIPGTGGSPTESGIWFAEQALLSTAAGDATDGTVTVAGSPRVDASLSIIVMSDEPDFYDSYAYCSDCFDTSNNLFTNRGYRVYSIVDTDEFSYDYGLDYIDLSTATNGSYAAINDLTTFSQIMYNIAVAAGGASSSYTLNNSPISSSISITVNGTAVSESSTDGWTYDLTSNSIVFHGSSIPAQGDTVMITYTY